MPKTLPFNFLAFTQQDDLCITFQDFCRSWSKVLSNLVYIASALMSATHFGKLFLSLVADVFTVGLSDWLPICPLLFNASGRFVATGILLPQKAWYREHAPGLQQTTSEFFQLSFNLFLKLSNESKAHLQCFTAGT